MSARYYLPLRHDRMGKILFISHIQKHFPETKVEPFKNLNISNLIMESGVHSSLHQNCHHQIIYAKINLKVFYPPPYEREIWHYQRANVDLIQRAIEQFSWEKSFRNLNINEMVFLFDKTIENIFHQKLVSIQYN